MFRSYVCTVVVPLVTTLQSLPRAPNSNPPNCGLSNTYMQGRGSTAVHPHWSFIPGAALEDGCCRCCLWTFVGRSCSLRPHGSRTDLSVQPHVFRHSFLICLTSNHCSPSICLCGLLQPFVTQKGSSLCSMMFQVLYTGAHWTEECSCLPTTSTEQYSTRHRRTQVFERPPLFPTKNTPP